MPLDLKYSEIAVHRLAALIRRNGELPAGSAIMQSLERISGVSVFLIKSPISLDLSPISPTTMTSDSEWRVIICKRTLLPTPDPAIIPRRCPRPIVNSPFIDLTPVSNALSIGALSMD